MKIISPKKLIEVALPLDAINEASAREKSIRHGHPSTLHLWWARRPLAAARAVIFAQMVNDAESLWRCQNPSVEPSPQVKGHWTKARARYFRIIEDLVKWENTTNEAVLKTARDAIAESWKATCALNKNHPNASELFNPEKLPGLHDPFAGGGAIPLEAQRLGLEAYASDLNPVAVLINKAMIEIPPKFAGRAPVHPEAKGSLLKWKGAEGLAEDVRRYGEWMRDEAKKRIGHLYPEVEITKEMASERPDLKLLVGQKLTVIAWIWARTVKSPNPALSGIEVPLASTFVLSSKEGKEAYVEPVIEKKGYRFRVKVGKPPKGAKEGTKLARGANFKCVMSETSIDDRYIKAESMAGRMGSRLMAIVAEGARGRVYLAPSEEHERIARSAVPKWKPDQLMPENPRWFSPPAFGMKAFGDLFTPRQLVALTTFSDLVGEARERILKDATMAGLQDDGKGLEAGGVGAKAYAEAVSVYLGFGASRAADAWSSVVTWRNQVEASRNTFARQALPMTWDFTEVSPFSDSCGNWLGNSIEWVHKSLLSLPGKAPDSLVMQADASIQTLSKYKAISTDPPYYDNIGYADLSDFFYVWLRRTLKDVFSGVCGTIAVPKEEELIAAPYRHGGRESAEKFFLDGMTGAMNRLASQAHPEFPVTIYYAFKQSERDDSDETSNTGWDTFLAAVLKSGFSIHGTWPMRTEKEGRTIGNGTNALASSIVLVCRPRESNAGTITRKQFIRELNKTLPEALDAMTRVDEGEHSPVAPVDLSQAIIGPGMAIFSRYQAVLEADGSPMPVRTALQLINRFLAQDDFDSDTQFCLDWFHEVGWEAGKFGQANTLAMAKGTSVDGVRDSGVIESGGGNVRLLRWKEYDPEWNPLTDSRMPVWEVLHQLIRIYKSEGDQGAGKVLAKVASKTEATRQLAYRLYTLCERKGWAEEARVYNELISGWAGIEQAASRIGGGSYESPEQTDFFETERKKK
jgi:putative DNA methylase